MEEIEIGLSNSNAATLFSDEDEEFDVWLGNLIYQDFSPEWAYYGGLMYYLKIWEFENDYLNGIEGGDNR